MGTLAAYGLSQFIVLLGAFVRIPLITEALGSTGYGLFVIITSVNPIVSMLAGGLAGAARISVADDPSSARLVLKRLRRFGTIEAGALITIGVIIAVAGRYMGVENVALALAVSIASVGAALPLAPYEGALEGFGRTATAHLALAANTLVGVPLLLIGLKVSESLEMVVFATALGMATPYLVATLALRRLTAYRNVAPLNYDARAKLPARELRRLSGAMTGWSLANLLVYVADAAILGIFVSPAAAGEYGLGWRILVLVTAVPEALGNLLTVHFARLRADPVRRDQLPRTIVNLTFAFCAVGVVLGTACAVWGPTIGELLAKGEVATPRSLYVSLGVFGAITSTTAPLLAACAAQNLAALRARVGLVFGVVNIALSVPLALWLGSAGPIVASVICVSVIAVFLTYRIYAQPGRIKGTDREIDA